MRKISSEIKLINDDFKIKVCTTDKRNPETIFIETGSYITPLDNEISFKDRISLIEKSAKRHIKDTIRKTNICENDFILITDIASDRMSLNKKTYFELQVFLKPTNATLEKHNHNFKAIVDEINDSYVKEFLPFLKKEIDSYDFVFSKAK